MAKREYTIQTKKNSGLKTVLEKMEWGCGFGRDPVGIGCHGFSIYTKWVFNQKKG